MWHKTYIASPVRCVSAGLGCLLLVLLGPGAAWSQPYVTAGAGYASVDFSLDEPYNGVVDESTLTYGVDVGFAVRNLGLELGVRRYGNVDGQGTPCPPGGICPQIVRPISGNDITAYKLSLLPHFEVGSVVLFAEAGYYRADIDTSVALADSDFTERGLIVGAGARWYFDGPWSISLRGARLDDNVRQIVVGAGWGLRLGSN